MTAQVQVPGAALVKTDSGTASALESLGYSINGIEVTEEMLTEDVNADQNGGEGGPPVDVQDFGHIARIRMELSWWDFAVANRIRQRLNPNGTVQSPVVAAGVSPIPGSLLFAAAYTYRLLILPSGTVPGGISGTGGAMNFLKAIPRDPYVINIGTKFARLIFDWIAYPPVGGGTLWNTTTT